MHKLNNFDLIRLTFAVVVVLAHCHDLSEQKALWLIPYVASSHVAVEGFFVISGYLIIMSYERSSSIWKYFKKRLLRILPGYWAALVFCLVLGSLTTKLTQRNFWESLVTVKYVAACISFSNFIQPSLPGVFLGNPFTSAMNGALWTIKIEIGFYLLVPIIVYLCQKFGQWQVILPILLLSNTLRVICHTIGSESISSQLPGQLCFFMVGALAYYYRSQFEMNRRAVWLTGITCYALSFFVGHTFLRPIAIGALVLCFALYFPHSQGPTRYGDFSYGLYVLHFPVVQTLVYYGFFSRCPWLASVAALSIALLLAVAAWNWVEKPFLATRNHSSRTGLPPALIS
jgi:peptidoglycan/LPS O-acetylase OafA/YrhL